MSLKKIVQVAFVGYAALFICACSTTGTGKNNSDTMNDQEGVQTAGLGDEQGFGNGKLSSKQLLAKRTYYFSFDRSELSAQDKQAVIANAEYLVSHPHAKIILEGHTDPRGSREYNVGLGERRADAVLELLKSRGVNPKQIHVVSYGAERLASPLHTEEGYQKDRRAMILYS